MSKKEQSWDEWIEACFWRTGVSSIPVVSIEDLRARLATLAQLLNQQQLAVSSSSPKAAKVEREASDFPGANEIWAQAVKDADEEEARQLSRGVEWSEELRFIVDTWRTSGLEHAKKGDDTRWAVFSVLCARLELFLAKYAPLPGEK